jgi:hypothetical protein
MSLQGKIMFEPFVAPKDLNTFMIYRYVGATK